MLLDHLGERRPLAPLHVPPVEDGVVELRDISVRQVLLELIELRRLLLLRLLLLHLAEEAAKAHLALLRVRLWDRIPNFGYTILTDGCVTW